MSAKALFIYTLSITLGIGAATHAKSQLIEQGLQEAPQTEELAYHFFFPSHQGFQLSCDEPRCLSYAPNHWSRWTV